MQHILVLPMSDPNGGLFSLLEMVRGDVKDHFSRVILGVLPGSSFPADPFFQTVEIAAGLPVGEQFRLLYEAAAKISPPDAALHLCFIDRLVFALRSGTRQAFLDDLHAIQSKDLPLLFLRSADAWETHPQNYREIENIATQLGRWVLGKTLDFAWCHLVIGGARLGEVMREVQATDLSLLAEMVLELNSELKTRDAAWLAWEDPFILDKPAEALKREREESREETRKRLGYILPTLQLLSAYGQAKITRLQAEKVDLEYTPE